MTNNRKDVLLLVMHGIHRPVGRMRLVKMLYLFGEENQPKQNLGIDPYYSFEATRHGAFSHRIYDDLLFLEHGCGLVRQTPANRDIIREEADEWNRWLNDFLGMEPAAPFSECPAERFELTPAGRDFVAGRLLPALDFRQARQIDQFCSHLRDIPLRALLAHLHMAYPGMCTPQAAEAA